MMPLCAGNGMENSAPLHIKNHCEPGKQQGQYLTYPRTLKPLTVRYRVADLKPTGGADFKTHWWARSNV
jgi:hypothetical protein